MSTSKHIWSEMFGPQVEPQYRREFVAPRTPIESELADLWARLLNFDQVSIYDKFLEMGGHSLLATQMINKLNKKYNITLTMRYLIARDLTVASLAKAVEDLLLDRANPEELQKMLQDIDKLSDEEVKKLLEQKKTSGI